MNRVVAQVYAITVSHEGGPLSDAQKTKLLDLVPVLVAEINKLDEIARDPFVRGYLEAKSQWTNQ